MKNSTKDTDAEKPKTDVGKQDAEYLAKLDEAFEQLYSGKGVEHELIEDN